jgi:demethylmenaquinone methyltransferase / 2-methoxy-6-polyprenyl-1,4-benzoquinol methylase
MPLDKSADNIREMFGEIAGRYDFLNRLLSLGIDRSWRRKTVRLVPPQGDAPILDVCTGTADLALAYWKASHGTIPIVAADFCPPMLAIARDKCRRAGALCLASAVTVPQGLAAAVTVPQGLAAAGTAAQGITLIEADTLHLPFPNDTFQIVSVAFGLRNLADTDAGLREMVRVCRPGGCVAILEFSTPTAWPLGAIYSWYFQHVLPRIGQALARNRRAAYNYLPQSVGQFPQGEDLANRMRAAGLRDVELHAFTFGVATLYFGKKGLGIRD